jgi:hypothetical protein
MSAATQHACLGLWNKVSSGVGGRRLTCLWHIQRDDLPPDCALQLRTIDVRPPHGFIIRNDLEGKGDNRYTPCSVQHLIKNVGGLHRDTAGNAGSFAGDARVNRNVPATHLVRSQ